MEIWIFLKEQRELLFLHTEAEAVVIAHATSTLHRNFRKNGLGTLLFDLLTAEEERIDMVTAHLRFDIDMLANRLVDITNWLLR